MAFSLPANLSFFFLYEDRRNRIEHRKRYESLMRMSINDLFVSILEMVLTFSMKTI